MTITADRRDVLRFRIRAQQLDSAVDSVELADAAVLDLGVQDTGADAASWALANRGVRVPEVSSLQQSFAVALAWTIRGAPHYYRRADLPDVQIATSPFSEADAGKRIYDANRPLKAAGIPARRALTEVAVELRDLVSGPMVKGEVSGALAERMGAPYLRFCRPCQATHLYEMPFRLSALHAGLDLVPGTSPPVLRPAADWPDRPPGPAGDPTEAPAQLQPIRACLRLLGPATPAEVAAYLEAPLVDVKKRWPADATEIVVDGVASWTLNPDLPGAVEPVVRLLGPFDLMLQARDRHRLVPDAARHKQLWPTLGRPGAVLVDADIVGTWRPQAAGRKFSVRLDVWQPLSRSVRAAVEEQAARLSAHRHLAFQGCVD